MRGRTILALLLVAVVNAAGCGGSDHKTVNPEVMLDAAAAHPVTSANTDLDLRVAVSGVEQLSGPLRLRLSGPYVSGAGRTVPRFDWRMNASALGFPVGGHLALDRRQRLPDGLWRQLRGGERTPWPPRTRGSRSRRPSIPGSWFGRARVVGQGNEGGADCERISAPLRGDAMARDLEPLLGGLGLTETPSVTGRATACVGFDDRVLHELEIGAVLERPRCGSGGAAGRHLHRHRPRPGDQRRRAGAGDLGPAGWRNTADPGPGADPQRPGRPNSPVGAWAIRLRAWNQAVEAPRSDAPPPRRAPALARMSRLRPAMRS